MYIAPAKLCTIYKLLQSYTWKISLTSTIGAVDDLFILNDDPGPVFSANKRSASGQCLYNFGCVTKVQARAVATGMKNKNILSNALS